MLAGLILARYNEFILMHVRVAPMHVFTMKNGEAKIKLTRHLCSLCKIARSLLELIEKLPDSDEFSSQITSKVIQLSRELSAVLVH